MKKSVLFAIAGIFSMASTGLAQTHDIESLLVLSKRDHTLAVVDPATRKLLARVPVGNDPHEVIASADGKTAYISNYGFGAYNTLAVVDLVEQKALPAIDLGPLRGPHGLAFVGGKTWFTAEGAKAIASYDPAAKKVDWIMGTGQNRTHMIFVSEDQKRIVTTNVSSGTVTILEKTLRRGGPPPGPPPGTQPPGTQPPGTAPGMPPRPPNAGGPAGPMGPATPDWDETVVKVGNGSEGFDISPDGKEIWVANAQDGTVSIVNVANKEVTQTLAANVGGANRLKFTLDGKRVLISSLGGSDLVILDASTHKEVKRINIGHGAAGIVMQPDGTHAYVACSPDDYVAVFDLKTLEVASRIAAGGEPDGLAWAVRH